MFWERLLKEFLVLSLRSIYPAAQDGSVRDFKQKHRALCTERESKMCETVRVFREIVKMLVHIESVFVVVNSRFFLMQKRVTRKIATFSVSVLYDSNSYFGSRTTSVYDVAMHQFNKSQIQGAPDVFCCKLFSAEEYKLVLRLQIGNCSSITLFHTVSLRKAGIDVKVSSISINKLKTANICNEQTYERKHAFSALICTVSLHHCFSVSGSFCRSLFIFIPRNISTTTLQKSTVTTLISQELTSFR